MDLFLQLCYSEKKVLNREISCMANTYHKFLKKNIDLAPLGVEHSANEAVYFCTPKGTSIIGWAGVDGIHYCFIRGFGEMVLQSAP